MKTKVLAHNTLEVNVVSENTWNENMFVKVASKSKKKLSVTKTDAKYLLVQVPPTVDGQGKTQEGIFRSYTQPAMLDNTPLRIQSQTLTVQEKQFTSLRQVEAYRNERIVISMKKPICKF